MGTSVFRGTVERARLNLVLIKNGHYLIASALNVNEHNREMSCVKCTVSLSTQTAQGRLNVAWLTYIPRSPK